jgi:inosose dehydratase
VALPLEEEARRAQGIEHALTVARLLATQGVRELIVADDDDEERAACAGRVPPDGSAGWTDAEWRAAARTLETLARTLARELGLRVVVHHHAGTHIETPEEVDRLLRETDPALVGLLLDTGHAAYGGGDAVALLARHGARVRYIHLKDARADELARVRSTAVSMREAWGRGVFCPLGEGVVDFPRLAEEMRRRAYGGWAIVEQDVVPGEDGRLHPDPAGSAARSRAYLERECGL